MNLSTEGVSPNQSNENQREPFTANTLQAQPEGQARSEFEKFAAGAVLATPSGPKTAPVKQKKRGRPRKYPKKIVQHRAPESVLTGPASVDLRSSIEQTDPTQGGSPITTPHEPVSFAPITKDMIKTLSRLPATRYKSKALVLTDDEAMQIATSLDAVINIYLPDLEGMDPKTAAILGLTVTTASIFIAKIQAYELEQSQLQIKTEG